MRASLRVGVITALLLSCGGIVHAQDPVVGVADADALFHSKNPKYEKNKQAAYHIMKELLEANHWDMADQWLTERYIQHNPQAGEWARRRREVLYGSPTHASHRPFPINWVRPSSLSLPKATM